ncbi:unnamed protein product [Adineta steineri]|uniref:F-box domain-containing protein n=1 Tax=Adineta steineri TaxID=433720 RepID=A0A819TVU4_9BILA|nr:unnamed protein product [Adineta steineri]CAF4081556.1 unnamed protein product [Adineta steineri]
MAQSKSSITIIGKELQSLFIRKTIIESKLLITQFENLSNELIYEIFDFLDIYDIYEGFHNLNKRFQNLLINSTLPIGINLSSISKFDFDYFYTNIFLRYQHRIKSVRLSNIFLGPMVFSQSSILSQLEKVVLKNIEANCLETLLSQFISLTNLNSLTIHCDYNIENKTTYYRSIFHFPALKYCNILLEDYIHNRITPISFNENSPIEYLIIKNRLYLEEMHHIVSHTPQLRRLSLNHLSKFNSISTHMNSIMLNSLTHLNLNNISIQFDEFQIMIKNFVPKLEVLHISINEDKTYFNANQWEQFIETSMLNLRVFDIHISQLLNNSNNCDELYKQWFFEYNTYNNINQPYTQYGNNLIFYSINPYRKKEYTLYVDLFKNIYNKRRRNFSLHNMKAKENVSSTNGTNLMKSVNHIIIEDEDVLTNCVKYFPHVTQLSLFSSVQSEQFLSNILSRLIPLKQLTKLVIQNHYGHFSNIINLLQYSPNIKIFSIDSVSLDDDERRLIQLEETFQMVSKTNKIQELNMICESILEEVTFLVHLCPRLKYINFNKYGYHPKDILAFLLSKDNNNTQQLHFICFQGCNPEEFEKVTTLLKSENLTNISSISVGHFSCNRIYLWW